MLRFLVDAQLPPALARKIASLGYQAEHLLDLGLLEADDSTVWDHALTQHAVIITKDEDFAIRASVSKNAPAIVWVRIGNCANSRLLAWFEQEWPSIIATLEAGNRLVEIAG